MTSLFRARAAIHIADKAAVKPILRAVRGIDPGMAKLSLAANELVDVDASVLEAIKVGDIEKAYWLHHKLPPLHPCKWRCAVNAPDSFALDGFADYCMRVSRTQEPNSLLLAMRRGEYGTAHIDDLCAFHEDGLAPEVVLDLVSRLRIGSTFTSIKPGTAHEFWRRYYGRMATPLTDAVTIAFKLQTVHAAITDDLAGTVFGVGSP